MARTPGAFTTPDAVPLAPLRNNREVVRIPDDPSLEAMGRMGAAIREIGVRAREQQIQVQVAEADANAAREIGEIEERYRADPDWETAPQRSEQEVTAALQRYGQGLRGTAAQNAWAENTSRTLTQFRQRARVRAVERGTEAARGDIIRFGQQALEAAGNIATADDERRRWVENYAGIVHGAVERGLLGVDDAARLEVEFGENVRRRRAQGLSGEALGLLDTDPSALLTELQTEGGGRYRDMDPDDRARLTHDARRTLGSRNVAAALENTLRTGQITPETDPALAPYWNSLGPTARLEYAQRAAEYRERHSFGAAIATYSGGTLTDAARAAEQADSAAERAGANVVAGAMMNDTASVVRQGDPLVGRAWRTYHAAREAARTATGDAVGPAQTQMRRARRRFAEITIESQLARGVPRSRLRLLTNSELEGWSAQLITRSEAFQMRTLENLEANLVEAFGDEGLAAIAANEQRRYYAQYRSRNGRSPNPSPAAATPGPARDARPTAAARGANYDTVRATVMAVIRAGNTGSDTVVRSHVNRLSPADQQRLLADPEIRALMGQGE